LLPCKDDGSKARPAGATTAPPRGASAWRAFPSSRPSISSAGTGPPRLTESSSNITLP
jgi:hypothetical protein